MRRSIVVIVLGILAAVLPATVASAATFVVNSNGDQGDFNTADGVCWTSVGTCTLRAALEQANAGPSVDVVTLPAMTISVGSTLGITNPVSVLGAGPASTVLTSAGAVNILFMITGGDVTIQDLSIRGVTTTAYSAAIVQAGSATSTLRGVSIADSTWKTYAPVTVAQGSMTIDRSSITGNTTRADADDAFAGVHSQWAGTRVTITDSTIAGNTAEGKNAYAAVTARGAGEVIVRRSTIAGNALQGVTMGTGSNLYVDGPMTLPDSVVADPLAALPFPALNCFGTQAVTLTGRNVVSDDSCGAAGDAMIVADARLHPMLVGATGTVIRPLRGGSPAIDAVGCVPALDQRGVLRPVGARCDAGAAEASADGAVSMVASAATISITVSNGGPDDLDAAVLSLEAPAGVSLSGAGCSGSSCPVPVLHPGQTVRIELAVTGPAGIWSVTGTLSAGVPDPVAGNNAGSATVTVPTVPQPGDEAPSGGTPTTPGNVCSVIRKGTAGPDRLRGTAGSDRLLGRRGDDVLKGLAGDDCLDGGKGTDQLVAGRGDDRVAARDGVRDVVKCGSGRDKVAADRIDRIAKDCERILM